VQRMALFMKPAIQETQIARAYDAICTYRRDEFDS
jgi:hypothetical protein